MHFLELRASCYLEVTFLFHLAGRRVSGGGEWTCLRKSRLNQRSHAGEREGTLTVAVVAVFALFIVYGADEHGVVTST